MRRLVLLIVILLLEISGVQCQNYSYDEFNFKIVASNCIQFEFILMKDSNTYPYSNFEVKLWKWDSLSSNWILEKKLENRQKEDGKWVYTENNVIDGKYQLYIYYPPLGTGSYELMNEFEISEGGIPPPLLPLEVILTPENITSYVNNPIVFNCEGKGGVLPYVYEWDFGDSTTKVGDQTEYHTYTKSGKYIASVKIIDSSDSIAIDYAEVKIIDQKAVYPQQIKGNIAITVMDEGENLISIRVCGSSNILHAVLSCSPDPQSNLTLSAWSGPCGGNWGTQPFIIDPNVEYTFAVSGFSSEGECIAFDTTKFKYRERRLENEYERLYLYIEMARKKYSSIPENPLDAWIWLLDMYERAIDDIESNIRELTELKVKNQKLEAEYNLLLEEKIKLETELNILKNQPKPQVVEEPISEDKKPEESNNIGKGIIIMIVISMIAVVIYLGYRLGVKGRDEIDEEKIAKNWEEISDEEKMEIIKGIVKRDVEEFSKSKTGDKTITEFMSPIPYHILNTKWFDVYMELFVQIYGKDVEPNKIFEINVM